MQCENGLIPALIYSTLDNPTLEPYDPVSKRSAKYSLNDATIIVVESPLRFLTPPVAYDGWNQGLLWSDISDSVPVFHAPSHVAGSVSLQNVFVEFSPLETPSFSGAGDSTPTAELIRAAWLVRNGSGLSISLFIQTFPSGQIAGATIHRAAMDASTGTIRWESRTNQAGAGEKIEWKELTEMDLFAKQVFTILLILRELSPILKAAPFPSYVFDAGTDGQKMMVSSGKAAARLLRVQDSRTSRPLHFLRKPGLDEAFVGGRPQSALVFEINQPYSKIDPAWFRSTIAANAEAYEAAHAADPE